MLETVLNCTLAVITFVIVFYFASKSFKYFHSMLCEIDGADFIRKLIKDRDDAEKLINEINALAHQAPFTPNVLLKAASGLVVYGFKPQEVVPVLKVVGDIVTANPPSFQNFIISLGQVKAMSILTRYECKMFIEAGFSILEYLSRTCGRSIEEVKIDIEEGKISYEAVIAALELATEKGERYNGLMKVMRGKIYRLPMSRVWSKY